MKRFKRTERITLLAVFLVTVPILVFTIINDLNPGGGDIVLPFDYWIWRPVIMLTLPAFILVFIIAFMCYSPMTFNSKTRYAGAVGMMVSSYIFAAFLWIYSLGVVWVWDKGLTIAGLCIAYIGIIPFAVFVAFISGHLEFLIPIAVLAACFTAARARVKNALGELKKELPEGN